MNPNHEERGRPSPFVPPRCCPLPKVDAKIGPDPEHFLVEEIPAYPLSDQGEHVFLFIEKRELNTNDVVKRLAQASGIVERDIGYAGMKDRQAVTRQWFSVLYKGDDAARFDLGEGVRILETRRHNNKLRTGHLIGNRFTITLVGAAPEDLVRAEKITDYLKREGLANYYGAQRFGRGGNNLGFSLSWLNDQLGGKEGKSESSDRDRSDTRSRKRRSHKSSRFDNKLHPSVVQSELFNRYLSARLQLSDPLLLGEVVRLNGTGTHFIVEDLDRELPRKLSGDLILTGTMPGGKTLSPKHAAAKLEAETARAMGLSDDHMQCLLKIAPGARRDLYVALEDLTCVCEQDEIAISFVLPAGGYATQVIREYNDADWMSPRARASHQE